MLSSDAFEGRGPATAGETKSIDYISKQFTASAILLLQEQGKPLPPASEFQLRDDRAHECAVRSAVLFGTAPDGRVQIGPIRRSGPDDRSRR